MPWNNGAWWPIYVPQWWSPAVSRHPLDPYSLVHTQTGVILFYVFGFPIWYSLKEENESSPGFDSWHLWIGFGITLVLSLTFEIIENLPCIIDKYREASGTSSDYDGDSYQNIIGDLIVVQLGYMISWLFTFLGVPWVSAIWFLVVDIWLILYMRDSVLLFFNVFVKHQGIIAWQAKGVELGKARVERKQSIVCPPSVFLKTDEEEQETQVPLKS